VTLTVAFNLTQVPELRLVRGDILRQPLPALLDSLQAHRAAWLAGEAAAAAGGRTAAAAAGAAHVHGRTAAEQQAAGLPGRAHDLQQHSAAEQQQPQHRQPQQQQQQQQQQATEPPRVKVVANLPYYITKDCLLQVILLERVPPACVGLRSGRQLL
jgi:hypothetical protein